MRGLTRAAKRAGEMAFNASGGAVNWFPGHRAAASRAIRDRLKLCRPLVIEVRDARRWLNHFESCKQDCISINAHSSSSVNQPKLAKTEGDRSDRSA
ncbi:GTPase family protein, mRNA [Panicum miliaceum]|uniref:GTPase family protein, mRNA n=1 Tax=Panicum miliaceum TaxID=4540 RepID=A0A3L6PK22_PANMI|nr:GTPase family protein, mRNA [Panicum miliaceum]